MDSKAATPGKSVRRCRYSCARAWILEQAVIIGRNRWDYYRYSNIDFLNDPIPAVTCRRTGLVVIPKHWTTREEDQSQFPLSRPKFQRSGPGRTGQRLQVIDADGLSAGQPLATGIRDRSSMSSTVSTHKTQSRLSFIFGSSTASFNCDIQSAQWRRRHV